MTGQSFADLCRENGWEPGQLLVGDEGHGPTVIYVTAVGEAKILAKHVAHNGITVQNPMETSWYLNPRRNWSAQAPEPQS